MKKLLMVVGLVGFLMMSQPAAEAGVLDSVVEGAKSVVRVTVTVTHDVLHIAQNVAGSAMGVVHAALDVLQIPFESTSS